MHVVPFFLFSLLRHLREACFLSRLKGAARAISWSFHRFRAFYGARTLQTKKPLTRVSKRVPGAQGGPQKEGLGEGLAEKVGKGLTKGWRRVGGGLAKGWQRVSGFPCTLQFRNCRGARLETLVCDSMVYKPSHMQTGNNISH